ncbi:MAG: histidinol-phosphate transaminase [Actinobacteria bacterium]|nr:histidinol-phosphate transaminase [Actinomycetota bacterium]MCB9412215.1 histidinol-phosphate transaminase [Actinomycetota bacterium]
MRADWSPPVRSELVDASAYGAPQLDVEVRLNVNENPYGPSSATAADITAAVASAALELNRYPDRNAVALREALADYLNGRIGADGAGLTAANLWAANGSNEVMVQILQAFGGPGRTVLTFPPTYSMYPEYARTTHTELRTFARADDFSLDPAAAAAGVRRTAPDVVILTSPNNPTGTAASGALLAALLEAAPGIVVVDEAYAEFARDPGETALTLLPEHPHLLVCRTMSKAFALAGARVGYVAADPRVIDALQLVRLPYHLSAVTQATAIAALRHADELLAAVDLLRSERDRVVGWLRARGLTVADSDANFVLFGRFGDRHAVWQALLDRGVLIRETGPAGWLRASIGTPAENDAFLAALEEVLA